MNASAQCLRSIDSFTIEMYYKLQNPYTPLHFVYQGWLAFSSQLLAQSLVYFYLQSHFGFTTIFGGHFYCSEMWWFRNVVGTLFVRWTLSCQLFQMSELNLVKGLLCALRHHLGKPYKIILNWKNLSRWVFLNHRWRILRLIPWPVNVFNLLFYTLVNSMVFTRLLVVFHVVCL